MVACHMVARRDELRPADGVRMARRFSRTSPAILARPGSRRAQASACPVMSPVKLVSGSWRTCRSLTRHSGTRVTRRPAFKEGRHPLAEVK